MLLSNGIKLKFGIIVVQLTEFVSPGEQVMVLLPIPRKPMHAKYDGLYAVDYVTATRDCRKNVCHINLLKTIERSPLLLEPQFEQPVQYLRLLCW